MGQNRTGRNIRGQDEIRQFRTGQNITGQDRRGWDQLGLLNWFAFAKLTQLCTNFVLVKCKKGGVSLSALGS